MLHFALLLSAVVIRPVTQAPQDFRLIATGPPASEAPFEFTKVSQIAELRNGRLVVLDRLEGTVRLVQFPAGISSQFARVGDGPREYRLPSSLIPLGDDGVGIYDDANVRILVVRPDGTPGDFVTPFAYSDGTRIAGIVGDGNGHLLGELRPRSSADSAMLYRWRAGSDSAAVVTYVHKPLPDGAVALGRGVVRPGSFAQPSTRNMWQSAQDGTIALVAFRPYHVSFVRPNGGLLRGPPIPYQIVAVNEAIRNVYLAALPRRTTGVVVDGSGRTTTVQSPVPAVDPSTITWARELPPYLSDALVAFAPDGTLWIQRPTFGREGGRYDVVTREARLVDRVRLPEGLRIVGFGRDAMYVARRDADDLEYLQRRPLPR